MVVYLPVPDNATRILTTIIIHMHIIICMHTHVHMAYRESVAAAGLSPPLAALSLIISSKLDN